MQHSNVLEGSGPRHALSRMLNASARRLRRGPREQEQEQEPDREEVQDEGLDAEMEEDWTPFQRTVEEMMESGTTSGAGGSRPPPRGSEGMGAEQTSRRRQTTELWLVDKEMGGGPIDPCVIPSYGGHIARFIWEGHPEREELRGHTRGGVCNSLNKILGWLKPDVMQKIDGCGLLHLSRIMYRSLDMQLLAAFVERW